MPNNHGEGRLIGESPKPRVLLAWMSDDVDRIEARIHPFAPTITRIGHIREVRQLDYDVLVTDNPSTVLSAGPKVQRPLYPAPELFVISFTDATLIDRSIAPEGTWELRTHQRDYISEQIVIPNDLIADVDSLVNDNLVPHCRSRRHHTTYRLQLSIRTKEGPPPRFSPFLLTPDNIPLAGEYERSPGSAGWILPSDIPKTEAWIITALKRWSVLYGTFPLVGHWWHKERWQTRAETSASVRLQAARDELRQTTAKLEGEISAAKDELESAQRSAANGMRRLLDAKGDALEAAVTDALTLLGFKVLNLDHKQSPSGGKVEDLEVADPDDPTFDPVVEVKGYDKGAKSGDLSKLIRHVIRAQNARRDVGAIWWIVNHWRNMSPDDREELFSSEKALIEEHATEAPPLVIIDTRDLFRAVRSVEAGTDPSEVRASLRSAAGPWSLPVE